MGKGESTTNTSFFDRGKWEIRVFINYDTFKKAVNVFSVSVKLTPESNKGRER